jgi:hypothetical protein
MSYHIRSKSNCRGHERSQHPLEVARMRVQRAKSAWSDCAIAVSKRTPGAADMVAPALEELHAAFAAYDALVAAAYA